jgi:hypothetical protein
MICNSPSVNTTMLKSLCDQFLQDFTRHIENLHSILISCCPWESWRKEEEKAWELKRSWGHRPWSSWLLGRRRDDVSPASRARPSSYLGATSAGTSPGAGRHCASVSVGSRGVMPACHGHIRHPWRGGTDPEVVASCMAAVADKDKGERAVEWPRVLTGSC